MEDKIYEEINQKEIKAQKQYMKALGLINENHNIKKGTSKKDIDLITILSQLDLIEKNHKNIQIISEYHDYLIKFGISIGVGEGKKIIINAIKKDSRKFEELIKIDPKLYTSYNYEPEFIKDMKEAILNEK